MATRTTVYLDEEVLQRVRRHVPARGLSQLINDLLAEHASELERAELEARMREGYLAARQERQDAHEDWHVVDIEAWPE